MFGSFQLNGNLRTFMLIVYAHPYCALNSCCNAVLCHVLLLLLFLFYYFATQNKLQEKVNEIISGVTKGNKHCYITGDFNVDLQCAEA